MRACRAIKEVKTNTKTDNCKVKDNHMLVVGLEEGQNGKGEHIDENAT